MASARTCRNLPGAPRDHPVPTISAIYTTAVKSLALEPRAAVAVGVSGIAEDRRFHLIDGGGRLLTQRQRPQLATVTASYDPLSEQLTLTLPDGGRISGLIEETESVRTAIWGRPVPGQVVPGEWNEALSQVCGGPVRLVKTDDVGLSFDEYPLSLLSQASIDRLCQLTKGARNFEARRFRPNFLLDGCSPHEEDSWLGGVVAIGPGVRLRVVAPDPRCAITTIDPDTGQRDFDMPRFLLAYRPSARAPYFGVYAAVESTGTVTVGDTVEVVAPPPAR